MAFEALLGNDRLKKNLAESLARGHISHFYLISGPEGSGKHTLSRMLAEAILCEGSRKPCGTCVHCRKMRSGNHPDFITVEDPEHKNVAVKIVRQIRDDMFVRPNEAEHKIYLFPQELGLEGQNALLKILEEPPEYGVFLLLTDNPDKLLPTVRSRCTELKMQALDPRVIRDQLRREFPGAEEADLQAAVYRGGGFLGQARRLLAEGDQIPPQTEQFVESFCRKDPLLLTQVLVPMEKWKRDVLAEVLQSWLEILESALTSRAGLEAVSALGRQVAQQRTSGDIYRAVTVIKKALEYVGNNVSPAAVCGWLTWALR